MCCALVPDTSAFDLPIHDYVVVGVFFSAVSCFFFFSVRTCFFFSSFGVLCSGTRYAGHLFA